MPNQGIWSIRRWAVQAARQENTVTTINSLHDSTGRPAIRLDAVTRQMMIDHLRVADPDVYAAAELWVAEQTPRGGAEVDLAAYVCGHLALGIKVAALGADASHLAGMQEAMGAASDRTQQVVDAAAERATRASEAATKELDKATTAAAKAIDEAAEKSKKQLEDTAHKVGVDLAQLMGGENNPVAAAAAAAIAKSLTEVQAELELRTRRAVDDVARKFDLRDPTSPMGQLHVTLQAEQQKVTDAQQAAAQVTSAKLDEIKTNLVQLTESTTVKRKAAAVSPIKGHDHETQLHEVMESLSADHGDGYARTGNTTGSLGSSKKGDGVVTVHDVTGASDGAARVVVEMNNSDTAPRNWSAYLDTAMRNRNAEVALGIVRSPEQLPSGAVLQMWGCRRIVVAYDPVVDDPALLRAVYLLLRAQACLAAARSGVDQVRTAEEQLQAAAAQLTQFVELQKMVTTIKTNADKTVTKLGALQETLARHVTAALAALREASADGAAGAAAA